MGAARADPYPGGVSSDDYAPPLTRWGHVWRTVLVLLVSLVAAAAPAGPPWAVPELPGGPGADGLTVTPDGTKAAGNAEGGAGEPVGDIAGIARRAVPAPASDALAAAFCAAETFNLTNGWRTVWAP